MSCKLHGSFVGIGRRNRVRLTAETPSWGLTIQRISNFAFYLTRSCQPTPLNTRCEGYSLQQEPDTASVSPEGRNDEGGRSVCVPEYSSGSIVHRITPYVTVSNHIMSYIQYQTMKYNVTYHVIHQQYHIAHPITYHTIPYPPCHRDIHRGSTKFVRVVLYFIL